MIFPLWPQILPTMTFKPHFWTNYNFVLNSCTFRVSRFPVSHLTYETVKFGLQNTLNMSKTTRIHFGVLQLVSVDLCCNLSNFCRDRVHLLALSFLCCNKNYIVATQLLCSQSKGLSRQFSSIMSRHKNSLSRHKFLFQPLSSI